MDKTRITAAIWPWGTETRAQMEQAATDITEIGYTCFESVKSAIYAFDLDLQAYKEVLARYGLTVQSFYYHLPTQEHIDTFFRDLDKEFSFIAELGVRRICLQATNGRPAVMTRESLDDHLNLIGRFCEKAKNYGITPNLHNHYNTWVTYEDEIDYVMQNISPDLLSFAPDTAHLVCGLCDPFEIMKRYVNRINFTHFKDITDAENILSGSYEREGLAVYKNFCELGKGSIDFKPIFQLLIDHGYDGPLCEELDTAPISNKESARNNYQFLLEHYK